MANLSVGRVKAQGITRYVAPTGSNGGNDCSSGASPCATIQYAVNQAASGDTILVAQGIYTHNWVDDPCQSFLYKPEIGKVGDAVVCIVDKSLTILGGFSPGNWQTADRAANPAIIDGASVFRGVFLIGYNTTTASLDMEGFVIQNCFVRGPADPGIPKGFGAGMAVFGARVTLRDMLFQNNEARGEDTPSGAGGPGVGAGLGIEWSQPGTSSLLERVTFDGNRSYGGTGPDRGGLAYGAVFVNGSVTIDDATFTNNQALAGHSTGNGEAGGLLADALGGAMGGGGGAWVLKHITATGNSVVGGNATTQSGGGFGGAFHVEVAESFSLSDSYVAGNLARGGNGFDGGFAGGGGILLNQTPGTIERVRVISNTAQAGTSTTGTGNAGAAGGGGIYLWRTTSSPSPAGIIRNVIVADNYVALGSSGSAAAGGGGGGIMVQGLQADLTHVTIARNRLGPSLVSGQGLLVLATPGLSSGSANVNYSIIANHTGGAQRAVAVLVQEGNTVTFNRGLFAGNSIDTNAGGSGMPPGTFNGLDTMITATTVSFVSPGAPSYNYHLRVDSAAKDQAVASTAPVDIDGQRRPYGNAADLGADEYTPFPLTVASGDGFLHLDWSTGANVFAGGVNHYEALVDCAPGASPPNEGACGSPIQVGAVTDFGLTGLTNFRPYTVTVFAHDTANALVASSTTVSAMPTDKLIYLPMVLNAR